MLKLPKNLSIERDYEEERSLLEASRAYLDKGEREGTHASDLLDSRKAFFNWLNPGPLPDRLVNMFVVGQALHAIILCVKEGTHDYTRPPDSGTKVFQDLRYSPDILMREDGTPNEIKTTRSFYLPKQAYLPNDDTYHRYIEQLMIYMAAEDKIIGRLTLLYINHKEENRTVPSIFVFKITTTPEALAAFRKQMMATKELLDKAKATKDHTILPLCRPFMCRDCEHWNDCKPPGRYEHGQTSSKDWEA